ncbi:ATP-dependent Clp protease proteolytic subunit [Vibrio aestuarianus]|uniref:ATP-dependent Clp protease proteolytic subunit n=1 Tax=Vibrio aestuarianus TaxID=28171 RepID=UPI00237CB8D3|nr:ATP-dependent Clp protease proteolytic subunit [Vibrio aestuarianus]MDE1341218.1 ATP-dependent Clp protease proteolytic subunit [Vibrio aestuarianus]
MKSYNLTQKIAKNATTDALINDLKSDVDVAIVLEYNNGGCVRTAFDIVTAMINSNAKIEVTVKGYAKSMAAFIYCFSFSFYMNNSKRNITCLGGNGIPDPFLLLHKTRLKVDARDERFVFIDEILAYTPQTELEFYKNCNQTVNSTFKYYIDAVTTNQQIKTRHKKNYSNCADIILPVQGT